MIVIFISDYLGAKMKGHKNYEFVDAFLNGDNRLFIDPCMIERAEDPWSINAANTMRVFFDCLFEGLRERTLYTSGLLSHAGEQNATKLGYGNGWIQVSRPCWYHNGKELLLVPKWIVRKNFLFKAHQYLYSVIIERIKIANGWDDLKKVDIWNNLPRISEHWEYDTVIAYTREHPEALSEYHNHMPRFYRRARGCMTDADLDLVVYGRRTRESA